MANKNTIKLAGQTFNVGKKIDQGELKKIEAKTGYTPASILSKAQEKFNIGAGSGAKNYASPSTFTGNTSTSNVVNDFVPTATGGAGDLATIFQNYGTLQESIATIGAGATTQSASIRAEADKEIARAQADAQRYASELGLQGVKYGADKESEWRQAVSNIEVKGKLDLQPIINAGLERVAGIEAQSARDVAETTGKYGLESTKTQSASQEKLGKMQLAGSMYGLLGSMFG